MNTISGVFPGVSVALHAVYDGGALRHVRGRDLLGEHRQGGLRHDGAPPLQLTGSNEQNPTFDLPCREVFARGQRNIEVIGPIPEVEEEAAAVHAGYWN